MDRDRALTSIQRDAERVLALAVAAGDGPGGEVPTCPGWHLLDVASHLGRVYAMVATVLEGDADVPVDRDRIPSRPDHQPPAEWMRERLEIVLPMLRDAREDDVFWNFVDGPSSPVSFWWRRQMHETLIHRVDAELAAGEPVTQPDPADAADGVGEFLRLTGFKLVESDEVRRGEGMTLHLHATDAGDGAEWTVDAANRTYTEAHLKADIALRGPAFELDRWCWHREEPGAPVIESFGDREAADAWRPVI